MMERAKANPLRLLRYLGFLLLVVLVVVAGPGKMLRVALEARPSWLLVAFVLNVPQLGLKAFRWFLLVRWQGLRLSYPRALLAYFSCLLVGFLTPGRIGEVTKAFTLKYESGTSLSYALSSVVLDRMFDMYLLLSLGSLGIVRFALVGTVLSWPTFIALCVLLCIPLLFLHQRLTRWAGAWAIRLPVLRSRAAFLNEKVNQFADGLAVLRPGRILLAIGLTACAYAIFFLQCLCCAWALNFTLPVTDLVLLMAATNFLSFIPITVSGLGTREACLTFFLARVAPPQPQAVAVTFGLTLFLVLFVGGGLIGFVCWQWAPIGLRQAVQDFRNRKQV